MPLIAILALHMPAAAQDHLLPEESLFTGIYHEQALSLLSSRLGRMHGLEAFANAVVLPSFSREYVVVFERTKGDEYKLVCMQTAQSMGGYQQLNQLKSGRLRVSEHGEDTTQKEIAKLEAALPEDHMNVEASVIEIELDQELGQDIYTVWGHMLYETRYPEPDKVTPESRASFGAGLDGTTYHFSFFHNHQPLSGWVWDYPADGRVAKLVALTEAAKEVCELGGENVTTILSEKVAALTKALNK